MANLQNISSDLEKIVIPNLKEILEILRELKDKENESIKDLVEAGSAKIISEMKKCHCNKEILDQLKKTSPEDKDKVVIPVKDNTAEDEEPSPSKEKARRPRLYSFPNNSVGFSKLGTGENKNSITWPPEPRK